MKAHNAANNSQRRTDLELVEKLLAAARPLIRIPVGTARLADAVRILEFSLLLGRIGAGMPVAKREITKLLSQMPTQHTRSKLKMT